MHVTFDPLIRFSKVRYHWNPWTCPSSTHPMMSFSAMMDFPPFWISSKTLESLLLSQILSDRHQTWRGESAEYVLPTNCFFSPEVLPFAQNSESKFVAKPPNRKLAHISANLARIKTKLSTWTCDSIRRTLKKFGDLWPLGGAVIQKHAFWPITAVVLRITMY